MANWPCMYVSSQQPGVYKPNVISHRWIIPDTDCMRKYRDLVKGSKCAIYKCFHICMYVCMSTCYSAPSKISTQRRFRLQRGHWIGVSIASEGLAQGPYATAWGGFEPAILHLQGTELTPTPPRVMRNSSCELSFLVLVIVIELCYSIVLIVTLLCCWMVISNQCIVQ